MTTRAAQPTAQLMTAAAFWPVWKIEIFGIEMAAKKSRYDATVCCTFAEAYAAEVNGELLEALDEALGGQPWMAN